MKVSSALMALFTAGTLSAQRPPAQVVNARVILFGEATQTHEFQVAPGVTDQADTQVGFGIRLMGQVSQDSPWYWELAGRFPSHAHMVTNQDISSAPPANVLNLTGVRIEYSYWSVGAGYLFPLGTAADFGVHLEGRGETIKPLGDYSTTAGGMSTVDAHTVYFRPWARLSLDFKVPTGSFVTLFGGDAGFALIKTNQKSIPPLSQIDDSSVRAMAPAWSGDVFIGFQF